MPAAARAGRDGPRERELAASAPRAWSPPARPRCAAGTRPPARGCWSAPPPSPPEAGAAAAARRRAAGGRPARGRRRRDDPCDPGPGRRPPSGRAPGSSARSCGCRRVRPARRRARSPTRRSTCSPGARRDRALPALYLRAVQAWIEGRAAAADDDWARAAEYAHRAGDDATLLAILSWRASAALFGPTPAPEAIVRCSGFGDQVATARCARRRLSIHSRPCTP